MKTFLEIVAHDLYEKLGKDLSRTAVIFPNKRASLFFSEHLAHQASTPIWSPAYISIQELFTSLSPLKLSDPIRSVCELYKVYRAETNSEETLDDFYLWGELLIHDFDDVDKNMADATQLFSNLQELKKLEDLNFLSEEQQAAIREFFGHFAIEKSSELKQRFISVWNKLGPIYQQFRHNLRQQGIAYEGMLYRDVIEHLDATQLPYDHFALVGFNVLRRVEICLFDKLKEADKALFYWDYDTFYTQEPKQSQPPFVHEAGEFILRNQKMFPNELTEAHFSQMRQPKQIKFIASPTENAQARYLTQWFAQLPSCPEKENAVVLCNENLLQPVIHSLPQDVKHVNVTMGFPLSQTPVYSFVNVLTDLQTKGYDAQNGHYSYETVLAFLRHPYTKKLSPSASAVEHELCSKNRFFPLPSELKADAFLEKAFTPRQGNQALCTYLIEMLMEATTIFREEDQDRNDIFEQLYCESLFKSYTVINRLLSLIQQGDLVVNVLTFRRLLNRLLGKATIPFHGEPAIGLQIMGVLETRNLDFRNLLLLSVNEGKLPKVEAEASFIPYNLRKAFGLTTIEHQNSLYAYYFYRLIQRAETITLMYNNSTDGLNRGEMSRFMLQLLTESPHPILREQLEAGQTPLQEREITIEKTPEVIRILKENYANPKQTGWYISPSALNTYLNCRLCFYFKYVARIRKSDVVSAEIDNAAFGSIFHEAAENLYKDLTAHGAVINRSDLATVLKNKPLLHKYVDNAFKHFFFKIANTEQAEYNGTQLINRSVVIRYLENLIQLDMQYAPFTLVDVEKVVTDTIDVQMPSETLHIKFGGTIDRMDSKDGTLRIIDYKTGGKAAKVSNMEGVFTGKSRDHRIFQTFVYASIMCRKQSLSVSPGLLLIHRASTDDFSADIVFNKQPVTNFMELDEDFRQRLHDLLFEIFNPDVPFNQSDNRPDACRWCDYQDLCKIRDKD